MNHEEPLEGTVSNACSNPECQATAAALLREESDHQDTIKQYMAMSHGAQFQVWRAGNAVDRARALRACATAILYTTALYHIIFDPSIWPRLGGVVMIVLCHTAMHKEA